jgi:hypothetical protein
MKNKLLIIIIMFWGSVTYGQLTGIKYIPGDYATLDMAVDSLNFYGVGTGGVTFNLEMGYSEDITAPIVITATGTAGNPISFQQGAPTKSTLSNPLVRRTDIGSVTTTALEAQGDGVIIIDGGDYITFDGIDIKTTTDAIEYGYFLRRASTLDGCKNVTIKNCAITMTKGSSPYVIGIYSSNLDASSPANNGAGITVGSAAGRMENLTITGNTISSVHIGIAVRGYNHTSAPYDRMDQNAVIGAPDAGNTIINFGGMSATSCAGVHLYYQTSPNISYNVINNVAGGGTDATAGCYGIWHQLSANVGNFVANNNAITMGMNGTGGGACIQATPAGVVDNSIVIQNNTFSFGTFVGSGTYYLITCNAARANNITVTNNSNVGSIFKSGASAHSFYGYSNNGYNYTGGTQTVSNNNFSNITLDAAGIFTGIDCRSGTGNAQINVISNNTISNIIAGGAVRGIYQSNGAVGSTVSYNTITGLINTGGSTGASNTAMGIMLGSNGGSLSLTCHHNTISELRGAEPVYGIWSNNGANNQIYQNNIFNLSNNTTSIGPIYGMIVNGGTTTTIYNNFISDLRGTNSTGDFVIMGVYVAAGTNVSLYNNTIYLDATTTATTFGTVGVYAKTANINFEMRNNIIVNTSQRAGNTGFTVAYRRFDNNLYSYSAASDNNLLYVSSNSNIGNYLYCEGSSTTPVTAKDSTMADYQARMYPREQSSFRELPPFVNVASTPYDIHLKNDVATLCESGGNTISSPAINVDFDGNPRYPNAGYPNSSNPAYAATHPDVGADEFGGIHAYLPISVDATVTNAICPTATNGSVNVTVIGGVPPYVYTWDNGSSSQNLTGLLPGTYKVTVTDYTSAHALGSWTVGYTGTICNDITVSGTVAGSGCYNAYQTITVSGLTVTAPAGHVELIAGEKIILLPGTIVQHGAWFYAHISGVYCPLADATMVSGLADNQEPQGLSATWFSIFPNPSTGNFTVSWKGSTITEPVKIEIFSMNGTRVMTGMMIGEKSHEMDSSSLPAGIYFVKLVAENHIETIKLIRTR